METIKINYKYTQGLLNEVYQTEKPFDRASYVMLWFMIATGFNRIFTKKDLEEFFFRMAIILDAMDLFENWMKYNELSYYKAESHKYLFTIEEIADHFGFEISSQVNNYEERSLFIANFSANIDIAEYECNKVGYSILPSPVKFSENFGSPEMNQQNRVNPEIFSNAEFFAWQLMKNIPESTYTDRSIALLEKEQELEKRRKWIKRMPTFDMTQISEDVIKKCLLILIGKNEQYLSKMMNEPIDVENFIQPMIYLAWLWANDFMESDGQSAWVKEGFYLNYDDYELEEGYTNLLETIRIYNIDKTRLLLKGLSI